VTFSTISYYPVSLNTHRGYAMQEQADLLNDAKSYFDHWRTTRTKRGKIPEYLWEKVKPLIGRYSLTTITETLNINTNQMRQHLDLGKDVNFVEVRTNREPRPHAISYPKIVAIDRHNKTCSIEIYRSTGGMLKIDDYPIESLDTMIAQFMR
jgi:hypothetical protein